MYRKLPKDQLNFYNVFHLGKKNSKGAQVFFNCTKKCCIGHGPRMTLRVSIKNSRYFSKVVNDKKDLIYHQLGDRMSVHLHLGLACMPKDLCSKLVSCPMCTLHRVLWMAEMMSMRQEIMAISISSLSALAYTI